AEYERSGMSEELQVDPRASTPVPAFREPRPADIGGAAGKRPIGEIFVERGLVTASQLEEALEEQKKSGGRLGEILVATGTLPRRRWPSGAANKWPPFKRLRPREETADGEPAAAAPADRIMPTPEVVVPVAATNGTATELAGRIEALSARVDELEATPVATD